MIRPRATFSCRPALRRRRRQSFVNPFDVLSSSAPSVFRTSPGQITSLALYSQALNETTWTAGPVPFPFSASERVALRCS